MGLNDTSIACLKYLKERGHIGLQKRVVELGAQQLGDRFLAAEDQILELGRLFGASTPFHSSPAAAASPFSPDPDILRPEAPFSRDFYEWLGFEYACVDIDDSPYSLPLDLNFDPVPARSRIQAPARARVTTSTSRCPRVREWAPTWRRYRPMSVGS